MHVRKENIIYIDMMMITMLLHDDDDDDGRRTVTLSYSFNYRREDIVSLSNHNPKDFFASHNCIASSSSASYGYRITAPTPVLIASPRHSPFATTQFNRRNKFRG